MNILDYRTNNWHYLFNFFLISNLKNLVLDKQNDKLNTYVDIYACYKTYVYM